MNWSRESGASADLVRSLDSFGLISAPDQQYDEHALKVAKACRQLEAHGIEPRHLRPFRAAADRELGLVERVVAPLPPDGTLPRRHGLPRLPGRSATSASACTVPWSTDK